MNRTSIGRPVGSRALAFGLLLAALVVSSLLLVARTAHAAEFIVTNTNDSGAGSLRQMILDTNANPGADTIKFNLPGNGPHTVAPNSPLPDITDVVVIDGYTQNGASPNTQK